MSKNDDFSNILHSMRGSFAIIANTVRSDYFAEGKSLDDGLVELIKKGVDKLEQSIKAMEDLVKIRNS